MKFAELLDFIEHDMRMSHVYQPVMIQTLLEHKGTASVEEIAQALVNKDRSQIEYYVHITHNMVGKVLRSHHVVERLQDKYRLLGADSFSNEENQALSAACDNRLRVYVRRRGNRIWQHRILSAGYITGTLRYEVLREARFHCELCGISADRRALEVDHVVPRSRGGSDDRSNLQALCYSCNAMKRDRDDTDFREVRRSYKYRDEGCAICTRSKTEHDFKNELAVGFLDCHPLTALHYLVVTHRHVESFFELGTSEVSACWQLVQKVRDRVLSTDRSVEGFNVRINQGLAGGQTTAHCHIDVIPRRLGDSKFVHD